MTNHGAPRPYLTKLANKLRKADRAKFSSDGVVVRYVNAKGETRLLGGPAESVLWAVA